MKKLQKSLMLITLIFALAVILGGSASATTQINIDVSYYNATGFNQAAFVANPSSYTPISQEYADNNPAVDVIKVIHMSNYGLAATESCIPTITDTLPSNVNYVTDNYWSVNAAGAWTNFGSTWYNPATGQWNPGMIGYNNGITKTNWWDNYLIIQLDLKRTDKDTTFTNTASLTNSDKFNVGTASDTETFTALSRARISVIKQIGTFTGGLFTPLAAPNLGYYNQDDLYIRYQIVNVSPTNEWSWLQLPTITDVLPQGLDLSPTRTTMYYRGILLPWTTTIPGTVNYDATTRTLTWIPGTDLASNSLGPLLKPQWNLLVPVKITDSNRLDTNNPPNPIINSLSVTSNTRIITTDPVNNPVTQPTATSWRISTAGTANAVINVGPASDVTITKRYVDALGNTITNIAQNTEFYIELVVTNNGPNPAQNVIVRDDLFALTPAVNFVVNYAAVQTIYNNGEPIIADPNVNWLPTTALNPTTFIWNIRSPGPADTMAVGTYRAYIPVKILLQGTYGPPTTPARNTAAVQQTNYNPHNGATISGAFYTIASAQVQINVLRAADIAVTKAANKTNVKVGDNVVFTIITTNNGPNRAFVTIQDVLSPGMSLVSWSGTDMTGNPYNKFIYNAATGVFDLSDNNTLGFFPGQFATITLIAHVDSIPEEGIKNTVKVNSSNALSGSLWYAIPDPDLSNNTAVVEFTTTPPTPPTPALTWTTIPNNGQIYSGLTAPLYVNFSNSGTVNGGTIKVYNNTTGKWISTPVFTQSGASQLKITFAKSRLKNNLYTVYIPAGIFTDSYGQKNTAFNWQFTATT